MISIEQLSSLSNYQNQPQKKFPPAVCPILVHHLYKVVNAKLRHGIQQ